MIDKEKYILIFIGIIIIIGIITFPTIQKKFIELRTKEKVLVNKEIQVQEDYYWYEPIQLSENLSQINIILHTQSGPEIEFYFLSEENFKKYKENKSFKYFGDLSSSGINIFEKEYSENLPFLRGQKYYLLIDNTDRGSVEPPKNFKDDMANITLKITTETIPPMFSENL